MDEKLNFEIVETFVIEQNEKKPAIRLNWFATNSYMIIRKDCLDELTDFLFFNTKEPNNWMLEKFDLKGFEMYDLFSVYNYSGWIMNQRDFSELIKLIEQYKEQRGKK